MDDRKKESQKTVVAFVAGLLIGGLLVWVFTERPEAPATNNNDRNGNTEVTENTNGNTSDDEEDDNDDVDTGTSTNTDASSDVDVADSTTTPTASATVDGNFSFSVADQRAGSTVALSDTTSYPTEQGWIVVHEDANGSLGNALGAARYNTTAGLTPDQVVLLRGTTSGNRYHVVYYSEDGDRIFDLNRDVPLQNEDGMIRASFEAR